jgi:hypothetical protein
MYFPHVFRRMLQVFPRFQTYIANVFSRCYKSRSRSCCTHLHAHGCGGGVSGWRGKLCRRKSRQSGHETHSSVGHGLICIFTYSTFYIFGWTFSAYFNRFVGGGRLGAWEGWEERRCSVSVNLHAVNWSLALSLSSTGRQLESGKRPRTKTIYRCIIKP